MSTNFIDSNSITIDRNYLNTKEKKKNGIFYTTDIDIIDRILDNSIDWISVKNSKILEPSVGTGVFVLRIIERLYYLNYSFKEIIHFTQESIYINDIDEHAINYVYNNIIMLINTLYDKNLETINIHTFNYDFTRKDSNDLFNEWTNELNTKKNYFDTVLGNPPFIALYGRRDKKKTEELRNYYLTNYMQFPNDLKNGKINVSMLFIEHSLYLLKPNGILSFILDVSFFETAYTYIRKLIIENYSIISLVYNVKAFDVASGQILISIKKQFPKSNYTIHVLDFENKSTLTIDSKVWQNANNEYKYEIIDEKALAIIDKIYKANVTTMEEILPTKTVRTCCMLLNMEDEFTTTEQNPSFFPYYEGSKSLKEKYGKFYFSKYFIYDKPKQDKINEKLKMQLKLQGIKNKKRIGLGEKEVYENPKLYIRQSAKEIIASLDLNRSAANNSLYAVSFRKNDIKSVNILKIILGQLNSKIITFLAQKKRIIRYSRGTQPQIKISDLLNIPIIADDEMTEKIFNYVNNYLSTENHLIYVNKLDDCIYNYYGINIKEREYIEKEVKNF